MKELIAYYHRDDTWYPFGTGSSDPNPPPVDTRDPFKWPYPSDSFWNMPVGDDAELVPLGFEYGGDNQFAAGRIAIAEENVLALDPDAPLAYIKATSAGWTGASRCGTRTGGNLVGNGSVSPMPQLPIPPGFTTETGPKYIGTTPNMSGALVYRDGADVKLFETQPLHFCLDGVAVSQFVNSDWVGDSAYYGGYGPPIPGGGSQEATGGSHGGSYMTAFGGTIRLGEMVPDGEIKHALKVTLDTGWYTSNVRTGRTTEGAGPNQATYTSPGPFQNKGGYIWPALQADSGWENSYGNLNPSVPDEAKMGMLLTVPNSYNPDLLVTEPARIIAHAVKNYGIYVVDGDHSAPVPWIVQWQVERSDEGAFVTEFKNTWGFEFFHKPADHGTPSATQMQWRADLGNLMEAIHIVVDNSPTNVGGAGARRAPMAPPLEVPA